MKKFFAVLGGMGTLATESYVRTVNRLTGAKKDQEYLDYVIFNHASVPDRTEYIMDHSKPNFLPYLEDDIEQINMMKPEFILIVCNTAHYFYDELQAKTEIPIIHMPRTAVSELKKNYPDEKKVGLIATKGTLADGIYNRELTNAGLEVETGSQELQDKVETLIYKYIKEQGIVNEQLYYEILQEMHDIYGCNVTVLGCTELSYAQEFAFQHPYNVIDAQGIMSQKSVDLGKKIRNNEVIDYDNI